MSKVPIQKVAIVPTSNAPPTWEWSKPSWYVLYLDALQASPDFNDTDAALLVAAFESRRITLPCPECRNHYANDWKTTPFTLAHARSPEAAVNWVQALKDRVDVRVAAEKAAEAAAAPKAAVLKRAPAPQAIAGKSIATRTPSIQTMRAVATRLAAAKPSATPALRAYALRSALHETAANRAGIVRGCRSCRKK